MKNRFFVFSIFVCIFVSSYTFFKEPFEGYFYYIIFLILLPIFFIKYGLPISPIKILIVPLLFGIIQIYEGNDTPELFAKIFFGILVSASFYYYVMVAFEFDVETLFVYYLKGVYIVTLIGYFQLFSYYIHFKPGYDFQWIFNKWSAVTNKDGEFRMNSILPEASQFAITLSPALFISIYNILFKKQVYLKRHQSILIIIAVIQSTSSLGLISFFVIALLLTINYGKFINFLIALVISIFIANIFYIYMPDFKSRVDSAKGLWIDNKYTIENVNNSSFILYNHWIVASENFKRHPLAGTGLGSHPLAFDLYSLTLLKEIIDFNFNKADANSMILRLLSETGIIGVSFMFYVIFRFFVRRNFQLPDNNYWLISNAVLVLIILYQLRQGNYFINGFPFFMWMYYYTKKVYKISLTQDTAEMRDRAFPDPEFSAQ